MNKDIKYTPESANSSIEKAKKFNYTDSIDYASHAIVSKVISRSKQGNITLFAFDEGEFLSEHTAPFDAVVQVLEGKVSIVIGGQEHQLSAGEAIIMPAGIAHALNALERFKMILTMIKN